MKTSMIRRRLLQALLCAALAPGALPGAAQGEEPIYYSFTYQGSLSDAGVAANGPYDLRFTIFDAAAGGSQVVGYVTQEDVQVVNGIFSVVLDWSNQPFLGGARWLQPEVRPGASTGAYTVLPRQKLYPTPFAIGLSLPHYQTLNSSSALFFMYNSGSGAAAELASSGTYGMIGRTFSSNFNAAGVRGEALATSGNVIGVEGVGLNSPSGTGLVGRGYATGAYIEGTGSGATGIWAFGKARALWAENTATGSAIHAVGAGQTRTNATVTVTNTQSSQGMCSYMYNNSNYATSHFQNNGSGQILWLEHPGTGHYIVATSGTDWKFWVDNAGVTHTKVLEILGGADLSERFDVHAEEAPIEPGMVVSIDRDVEGRLILSRHPYDRRVAGIVSGAGGVRPGMLMGQKGSVADGEQPIALTGRVYCRATATNGSIEPGDLLTTSPIPGHAMRVDDPSRAQGAILGKAMGSLQSGEGLVLVLVGLQ